MEKLFRKLLNFYIRQYCKNRLKILRRLELSLVQSSVELGNKELFKILLSLSDNGLSKELLCFKIREKFYIQKFILYSKKINKDIDVVLDIGANIGFFVLLEDYLFEKKKIFAFEPLPIAFSLLEKNIKINSSNKNIIQLYNYALGDFSGITNFYVSNSLNQSSILKKENTRQQIYVKIKRLSDFLAEKNIKTFFARMDIEGYEFNIFLDLKDFIKNLNNIFFSIEFHPHLLGDKALELIELWKELGFKLDYVIYNIPSIYEFFRKRNSKLYRIHKRLGFKLFQKEIKTAAKTKNFNEFKKLIEEYPLSYHIFLSKKRDIKNSSI